MATCTHQVSIILVHGAWADGSSWNDVTRTLLGKGYQVIAAPLPLTSLSDDVAALDRVLVRTNGPVVLAAHAYAGAVIGASRNARIRSLVFVAALAPDEGETVGDVFYREPPHAATPQLLPDDDGLIWMPHSGFAKAFAQRAPADRIALCAATQRPISLECIREKVARPGWKDTPSWYLIAEEDRMIPPVTQRFMSARMGARIRSAKLDHTPMVSAPEPVVELILEAAAGAAE